VTVGSGSIVCNDSDEGALNQIEKLLVRAHGIARFVSVACVLILLGIAVHPTPYPAILSEGRQRSDPQLSAQRALLNTTGATVTPFMADAFADSFGVNTRFNQGIYATQRAVVERLLVELGVRHIRDGGIWFKPEQRAFLKSLCTRYGVHSSFLVGDTDADATILQYIRDVPCLDMVEGPNELNGKPNWTQRLAAFVPHLYGLIRSSPAFAGVPVVAPSLTRLEDGDVLAHVIDISKYVDYGNKHSYPGERNIGGVDGTGAIGWGSAHEFCPQYTFGSFFFNLCGAELFSKDRPVWTTETGYGSTPNGLAAPMTSPPYAAIPYDVAAKYFPRLLAYEFGNGIPRTYIFALLDGSSGCSGPFNTFGLVEQDCPNTGTASSLHKKPQFDAVKNLMAEVSDPGPSFTPTPLRMKITGADAKVQTLLLQKRSGQYILLYWVEASDWNVNRGTYITVAPERVTLSVPGIGNSESAQTFGLDKTGSLTKAQTVGFSKDAVILSATDAMQFLTFNYPEHR
jgi:hypothetical protein